MGEIPLLAPWLQAVARAFAEVPVYAVGGAVRNTLMNLPVSDVDLCGPARPDTVMNLCKGTEIEPRLRAAHFGTVELHIGGHMAEYTTFRQDSYRGGHQPFAVRFADTVEADAMRRDFSVNALYTPLNDLGTVIDPTGGLPCLRERVLHTVTDDPDQVLKDDGLRILRAARFQAELGFTLTDAVLLSARKYASLLDEIAAERKRDELTRLLMADTKYPTLQRTAPPVSAGLRTLVRVGAWERLFYDLAPIDFSIMDHTAALGVGAKLALLYCYGTPAALLARMTALRYAKREALAAAGALAAMQGIENNSALSDVLRFGLAAVHTAKGMLAARAAADPKDWEALANAERILKQITERNLPESLRGLAVGGRELLGLCRETGAPRERIGSVLAALWKEAVDGQVPNTPSALRSRARKLLIDSPGDE